MENSKSFKAYFFRTKIVCTGIFFLSYMVYRMAGCTLFEYLCGQSLDIFIPIFFIIAYYILIGFGKLLLRFFKDLMMDFIVEVLFYVTTAMLIYSEAWYPYFYFRTGVIVLIDLVFAFFIFRKGLVLRYKLLEDKP